MQLGGPRLISAPSRLQHKAPRLLCRQEMRFNRWFKPHSRKPDADGGEAGSDRPNDNISGDSGHFKGYDHESLPAHAEQFLQLRMDQKRDDIESMQSRLDFARGFPGLQRNDKERGSSPGTQRGFVCRAMQGALDTVQKSLDEQELGVQGLRDFLPETEAYCRLVVKEQIQSGQPLDLDFLALPYTPNGYLSMREYAWRTQIYMDTFTGLTVGIPAALLGVAGNWQLTSQGWLPFLQWSLPLATASAVVAAASTIAQGQQQPTLGTLQPLQVIALGVQSLSETLLYRGLLLSVLMRVLGGGRNLGSPLPELDSLVIALSVGLVEGLIVYSVSCQGSSSSIQQLNNDVIASTTRDKMGALILTDLSRTTDIMLRWPQLAYCNSSLPPPPSFWVRLLMQRMLPDRPPRKLQIWPAVRIAVIGSLLSLEALLLDSLPAVAVTAFSIALAHAALSPSIRLSEEVYIGPDVISRLRKDLSEG